MNKIYSRILMAPLGILVLFACSPNQYQQLKEYDDVYFTSADRQQPPKVVVKAEPDAINTQVLSLENSSQNSLEPALLEKYTNTPSQEVSYYEVPGPKVTRATELNYDDFVLDYENKQLAYYALPLDWETEWDRAGFNHLIRDDFYFALAWYDQYYKGESGRMDDYLAGNSRRTNQNFDSFNSFDRFDSFGNRVNLNVGLGWGFGFGPSISVFGGGFYDPFFYDPFFDPWVGFRANRWRRRAWRRAFWGDPFWGGGWGGYYAYCPPLYNNFYFGNRNFNRINRGEFIEARTGRPATRGGRVRSTSIASVRSDARNGAVANLDSRSGRANLGSRNSRITKNSVANVSGARVRSNNVSGRVNRESVNRSSRSSINTAPRSSRTRTDAYRFSDARDASRSSRNRFGNGVSRDNESRTSRSRSSSSSRSYDSGRSSRTSLGSGISFGRSSSSRSLNQGNVRRGSSSYRGSSSGSRSSSRGSFSRGSSRSSSRSSGSVSRGSSSRSSSGSSRSSSRSSSSSKRSGRN